MRQRGALECPSDDAGFALVVALVMAVAIASTLLALQMLTLDIATASSDVADQAELRASLEAGLNRAIFAYLSPGDPLRSGLKSDGRALQWEFGQRRLILSVHAESGKWDLNSGDRQQIAGLLSHLVEDERAAAILDRLDRMRSNGFRISSVATLLAPIERLTEIRQIMEEHFTVMTGQRGVDPRTAPIDTLEALSFIPEASRRELLRARHELQVSSAESDADYSGLFVSEKPIYTFRAEARDKSGMSGAMEALVSFTERGEITIFSWSKASVHPEKS